MKHFVNLLFIFITVHGFTSGAEYKVNCANIQTVQKGKQGTELMITGHSTPLHVKESEDSVIAGCK